MATGEKTTIWKEWRSKSTSQTKAFRTHPGILSNKSLCHHASAMIAYTDVDGDICFCSLVGVVAKVARQDQDNRQLFVLYPESWPTHLYFAVEVRFRSASFAGDICMLQPK